MDKLIIFLTITSSILIGLGVLGAIFFVGYAAYVGGGIVPLIVYVLLILGLGKEGMDK